MPIPRESLVHDDDDLLSEALLDHETELVHADLQARGLILGTPAGDEHTHFLAAA